MARIKFTAATIESIKPTSVRVDYFDATVRGFGLRVTPTGAKTWFYWYRLPTGKARRWTIGRYGKDDKGGLALGTAREKARIAAGKLIDKGDDPAAAKSEQRRLKVVSDLAVDYMNLHARPSKKTWSRDQWILDKDVLPTLGHVPVRDVTRQRIQQLLDPIRDPNGRNAPGSVLPVRRLLSKMFNFALPRDYGIEYNPVTRTDAPKPGKRTRNLTDAELRRFLEALDAEAEAGHRNTATWLRLILLTGQRPGEVLAMRWDALDIFAPGRQSATAGFWDVKTSKNGDPMNAALSRDAVRVLRSWRDHSEREHARIERNMAGRRNPREMSAFVFPAGRAKRDRKDGLFIDEPMTNQLHNAIQRVRARMVGLSVEDLAALQHVGQTPAPADWEPRDLRRTCRTLMSKLGVSRDISERVLNHTDHSINSVYDRYEFQPQRLNAVNAVAAHLAKLRRLRLIAAS
jgi:integrase